MDLDFGVTLVLTFKGKDSRWSDDVQVDCRKGDNVCEVLLAGGEWDMCHCYNG